MSDTTSIPPALLRVLIVENRAETRETQQNNLSRWGFEPVLAEGSGPKLKDDAIDKARSFRCHLAIVDKRLIDDQDSSDFGGLDLIEKIAPTVAIILTGYADYATARNALKKGAFDVIRKEDGPTPLREALGKAAVEVWHRREIAFDRPPALESATLVRRFFPDDPAVPPDEVDDVLRRLFPNALSLRIETVSGDDTPPSLLLRIRSAVLKVVVDDAERPVIVKIARASRIDEEVRRFKEARPYFTAGRYAQIQEAPVTLWDLGGVVYDFIGDDNQYPVQVLASYYNTHSVEDIAKALESFHRLWRPLYQRKHTGNKDEPKKKHLLQAYTDVWGQGWLEELLQYRQFPAEIPLPSVFQELELPDPIEWLIARIDLKIVDEDDMGTDTASLPEEADRRAQRRRIQYNEHASSTTDLVYCHGDLHSRNLFVDDRHDVWPIDYERAGFGPVLQDWVELIVDILTMLADEKSVCLDSLVQLLTVILAPKTINADLSMGDTPGTHIEKEFHVIKHLLKVIVPTHYTGNARPLHWGLLLNALYRYTILRKDWDRLAKEVSGDQKRRGEHRRTLTVAIQRCLLIGGMVCHRLERWNTEIWPPPNWLRLFEKWENERRKKKKIGGNTVIKILFLAANPSDTTRLMLDKEYRGIRESIEKAGLREQFALTSEWAVRVGELIQLLTKQKPTIIHFSGHGSEAGEIILEDDGGNPFFLPQEPLKRILGILNRKDEQIRCVILNACFAEQQAKLIAEHVDIVVGISSEIGDVSAAKFASVFYAAIGERKDVQTAFDLARENIALHGLRYRDVLRLIPKSGVDPNEYFLA